MDTQFQNQVTKRFASMATMIGQAVTLHETPQRGVVLNDRYEITHEIGHGGFGIVYLAFDRRVADRPVVIKVLQEDQDNRELAAWNRAHFDEEIRSLSRINHPGVVRIYDAGKMPTGQAFFAMEYLSGVSLRSWMGNTPQLLSEISWVVHQIGAALTVVHEKGITHRDLKPENVMIHCDDSGEQRATLIDFGIALGAQPDQNKKTLLVGTLPYMAPEQLQGKPCPASDIWALGVITYELVTGCKPFNANNPFDLHQQQQAALFLPANQLRMDLPAAAAKVLQGALSYDPRQRPASARAFSEAFVAACAAGQTQPTVVLPGPIANSLVLSEPDQRSWWRRSWIIALAAVCSILLLAWKFHISQPPKVPDDPPPVWQPILSYSLTARAADNPQGGVVEMAQEVLFSGNVRLRLNLEIKKSGFVYLIDESPLLRKGMPQYIFLFPAPERGTALLSSPQKIFLPSENLSECFLVDTTAGTEKLWLIWSEEPLATLEGLRHWYGENPQAPGEIADAVDIRTFQSFLKKQAEAQLVTEKDNQQTLLKIAPTARLVIYAIRLAHV